LLRLLLPAWYAVRKKENPPADADVQIVLCTAIAIRGNNFLGRYREILCLPVFAPKMTDKVNKIKGLRQRELKVGVQKGYKPCVFTLTNKLGKQKKSH